MSELFIVLWHGPCTDLGKMNIGNSDTVRGLTTPLCSDDIWGLVGPVAVRFTRWWPLSFGVVSLLVFGSPDRDGQYFSPREV